PFQLYGGDPYRIPRLCLARGIGYLDLADGAAFVAGIDALDGEAVRAGVPVVSGLSTVPALSLAAADELAAGLATVEAVRVGIAPSPRVAVGLNVLRAILAYAGRPVPVWRSGRLVLAPGLSGLGRETIAPPGQVPLASRRFALVDVPDTLLVASRWPGLQRFEVGAGLSPAILHAGAVALARLARLPFAPSLVALAPVLARLAALLRFGAPRGGMFVSLDGVTPDGRPVRRRWDLIAEGDDGPFIPAMAAAIVLRDWAGGRAPPSGARTGAGLVSLVRFEEAFARLDIRTGRREGVPATAGRAEPLYRRALGPALDAAPKPVRALHDASGHATWTGRASVQRGRGLAARAAAALFRFPASGEDVPVSVRFERQDGRETWTRTFAGRRFRSRQTLGRGAWAGLVVERFGPIRVGLAMVLEDGRLRLSVRRWSIAGLPLPLALGPSAGDTYEGAQGERFRFHVEIWLPFGIFVVRYVGWLAPEPAP
ncbi:MAG: DUF4166 domain-containing protein, partial [Methylobacteriaceae bacterium]|nr:DUF4166 domain-containing protein [Methylobacteriaceae bacterium]